MKPDTRPAPPTAVAPAAVPPSAARLEYLFRRVGGAAATHPLLTLVRAYRAARPCDDRAPAETGAGHG